MHIHVYAHVWLYSGLAYIGETGKPFYNSDRKVMTNIYTVIVQNSTSINCRFAGQTPSQMLTSFLFTCREWVNFSDKFIPSKLSLLLLMGV